MSLGRFAVLSLLVAGLLGGSKDAFAQACCTGASGLVPGWLTPHEKALVGMQVRLSETIGTYPTSGPFYAPTPERDSRLETSLFGSVRYLPRGQVSALVPFVETRRRNGALVEGRFAPGDTAVVTRYDLIRDGESPLPGVALLAGLQAPTGTPSDKATGLLAADTTGIGTWEASVGASVEHAEGHLTLHATFLSGYRFPRAVLGLDQHLGLRALYVLGAGWITDSEVAILGTVSHTSEGDATVAGSTSPGTGNRTTQLALLVIVPITDTLRLRTTAFTDVPPLGANRPVMAGSSLSLSKSWF